MIENPTAVQFCDTRIRPMADQFAQCFAMAQSLQNQWNAQQLGGVITNTADVIDDGAGVTDGRNPITGINATAIVTLAEAFVTLYSANNNADLNATLICAVNTQGKF